MRTSSGLIRLAAASVLMTSLGLQCPNDTPVVPGPGRISTTSPIDGVTNIAANATMRITFSQAASPDSFASTITPAIDVTASWSSDNTAVTLAPAVDLAYSTMYTVTVSAVSFADGSALEAPYSFRFTTLAAGTGFSDKWALWSSGRTRLRGADLHPCSVTNTQTNTCAQTITMQDVQDLRNTGANLINASYPGLFDEQPPYNVNPTAQGDLDNLIAWAQQVGIYVVIHPRSGPGRNEAAITNPTGNPLTTVWTDRAAHDGWIEMWRYMAQRYGEKSVVVGYNLMVEPHVNTWVDPQGTLTPEQFAQQHAGGLADWNGFAAEITAAIRQVDTETPIIINSLLWASASWFPALVPTGDSRTVYSFHSYDPDIYTTQADGATVRYPSVVDGITFDRSWLEETFRPVRQFAQQHQVPIYVGEFGLFRWVSDATVFIADEIGLFEQYGWNYAYYVWRGDEPDFDGFNVEYGADRANATAIPNNPLQRAFIANWPQNSDFPPEAN